MQMLSLQGLLSLFILSAGHLRGPDLLPCVAGRLRRQSCGVTSSTIALTQLDIS